jgi:hypothetical protein
MESNNYLYSECQLGLTLNSCQSPNISLSISIAPPSLLQKIGKPLPIFAPWTISNYFCNIPSSLAGSPISNSFLRCCVIDPPSFRSSMRSPVNTIGCSLPDKNYYCFHICQIYPFYLCNTFPLVSPLIL